MFKENPDWVYICPDQWCAHGFWARVGGRTEAERDESRDRLEWQSTDRAMARVAAKIYIAKRSDGIYGMFASVPLNTNDEIFDIREGTKRVHSDIHTIEVKDGHYFHSYGRYTNHSCDSSTFVDKESGYLVAAHNIEIGEEITFDYLSTERDIKADFDCNCGSDNCVGTIRKGAEHD